MQRAGEHGIDGQQASAGYAKQDELAAPLDALEGAPGHVERDVAAEGAQDAGFQQRGGFYRNADDVIGEKVFDDFQFGRFRHFLSFGLTWMDKMDRIYHPHP